MHNTSFTTTVAPIPRCLALVICLLLLIAPAGAQDRLILGVHPYLQQAEVLKRFTPLADYLAEALGIPVEVRVGQSYQAHLNAITADQIDLAFLGPAVYVELLQNDQAKPLLVRLEANGSPSFRGHIVVREDSPIRALSDVRGKVFAFGDRHSTMSYMVPRALLAHVGIELSDLEAYREYKGHTNVALAVLGGDADAGAIKEEIYQRFKPRGLRSLQATPEISEHVFVARTGMSRAMVDRLRKLLLAIREPGQVERLLKPIKTTASGLVTATPSDYDNLRRLMQRLQE